VTHIDEHGIKRDDTPGASKRFTDLLDRNIDKIIRYSQLSYMNNTPVPLVYTEHKSSRGIKLITIHPDHI